MDSAAGATNYRPETGQLVCPAHPMQKPHFRAGLMLESPGMRKLSRMSVSTSNWVEKRDVSRTDCCLGATRTGGNWIHAVVAEMATTRVANRVLREIILSSPHQ